MQGQSSPGKVIPEEPSERDANVGHSWSFRIGTIGYATTVKRGPDIRRFS